jgi:cell fate regulator YaaT (PSP1 superfamily)
MNIAEVQFSPWDKKYWFSVGDLEIQKKDKVIVLTELGYEFGEVVGFADFDFKKMEQMKVKDIQRKATGQEIKTVNDKAKDKGKVMETCREVVKKHGLDMKIVDVHFSFDNKRMTFAFIADGRIDFRELVKEVAKKTRKIIRFYQMGVRDEAKVFGEHGPCGQELCCKKFLKNLGQVTGDFADIQQVNHRGSERLSGPCSRLKCCLRFEQKMYEELTAGLPNLGDKIKTEKGPGVVVEKCPLKGSVKVKISGKERIYLEIPIKKK